jgi:hypothetical protein
MLSEAKSVSPKSCTIVARSISLHKCLKDGHKIVLMEEARNVPTQDVEIGVLVCKQNYYSRQSDTGKDACRALNDKGSSR